ncbi:TonB-dependent receptor, partial [bacterium]|nr:TonB-dependent receptor [bacterium]
MTFRTHRGIRPAIALLLSLWQAGSLQAAQINGVIRDGENGEPLGFAQVLIVGLERGVVAHSDGTFHILRLPEGDLTLRVSRIGYHDLSRSVTLAARDTLTIEFALLPDHLKIPEVISEAKRPGAQLTLSTTLSGRTLQEKLGATIAEPLESTVGIAVRTMGPAPARPVSRGMGGARLTILEDGRPTGDLSASSSDHAVAIDPLLAQSVTIVRGPSAYHYGSSVMGGVVNILRNLTQEAEPHRLSGRALMHGSSASSSAGSSVALTIPLKEISAHGDMSLKRSGDVCTPYGTLENTQSELVSGSFGLRLVDQWGNADVVFSRFATTYGLPGGFLGAHPNGVSLKLLREVGSSNLAWRVNRAACKELSAAYSFTRVHQQEFEAGGSLGVEFGLLEDHLSLDAKFGSRFGLKEIRLSADATLRDYETAAFSFTPDSRQYEGGVALSAERTAAAWSLSGAVRGDMTRVEPDFSDTSRVIGIIQARGFSGFSGAVRADRVLSTLWSVGCQLSRSFRAPQTEELFSEGPHLAAYSYEIGNTSLPAEFGWGLEADLVQKSDYLNLRFGAYANRFTSYIFPQATGRPSS